MKTGKSIVELAQELQNLSAKKKDLVVDTREMRMLSTGTTLFVNATDLTINELAHTQIGQRTDIPKKYYQRMLAENPKLLAKNVNTWFDTQPKRRMVRTIDGVARAFLSDRYRRIDNEQIAEAVLPVLLNSSSDFEIVSSDITDTKMYIQARLPRLEGEVVVGDPVQAGLIITNSEVGLGAIDIKPMIYRLVCTNGMVTGDVIADGRMRRSHLGRQLVSDESGIVFQDDTNEADDKALMLKIRDTIKQLSDPMLFKALMDQMRAAASSEKVINPVQAIEELGKAYSLPQGEQDSILENLIRDQDYSKWGVLNAVTNTANSVSSYDRSVELETMGGSILTLPETSWHKLAIAA